MKKIPHILFLCALAMFATAKPAYRGPLVRTMPDGSEKIVYMHGDECAHFITDDEGRWLDERTLEPMTDGAKALLQNRHNVAKARRAQEQTAAAPNIAPRGLVILVNFQDLEFKTPRDTIDSMLNAVNYARKYSYMGRTATGRLTRRTVTSQGSARQYFQDQSYGQYNPVFDVVGPVTVSQKMSYYGENDASGNDKHPGEMIKEACQQADALGIDFAQDDNDNDKKVDFVYVIYAGYGEADGGGDSTIWPHKYQLTYSGISCILDGKRVDMYACGCEFNNNSKVYDGIGTFCHEFGHVLGLPDLYETNSTSQGLHTLGNWDIMDYGPYNNDGNTPPSYSAYERFFMGWLTPRILTEPEYVTLAPINEGDGESLMLVNGDRHNMIGYNPNPTTFYLLETRTKSGWDKPLTGPGMLITKIQYNSYRWMYNIVNNSASNMGVDILEAKTNTSNGAKATDAYPAGATEWTGFSGHEVTDIIRNSDGSVSFSYRGAEKPIPEAIDEVPMDGARCTKVLRNGQLYLLYKGQMYDVQGRRF